MQQKSLLGTRLDFKVNRDLTIGGTFLHYSEKPVTQKVNCKRPDFFGTLFFVSSLRAKVSVAKQSPRANEEIASQSLAMTCLF